MQKKGDNMNYEVVADKDFPAEWRVEAIDNKSGDIHVAVFSGPNAEQQAHQYMAWKNHEPPK